MDWWTEVRLLTETFLAQHGLLAAFAFLLIEEAGLPIPIPGDFLMVVLGVQARQGLVPFWSAVLTMEAATILGASFLYAMGGWGGKPLVYRYGRFVRLDPERLARVAGWLEKHGFLAVFVARLIPGLRIITALVCGVLGVRWWVFIPAMSLGAFVYLVAYALVGYLFGPPVLGFLEHLHLPLGLLGSLIPLVLILVWIVRARRGLHPRHEYRYMPSAAGQRVRAGALAGVIATIASTLLMSLLVNVAGNVAFSNPGTLIERTAVRLAVALAYDVGPLTLFVAAPAFMAVGTLWGAFYAGWIEPHLSFPDWVNGAAFALIPLATSLLIAMPLLGLGFFGVGGSGAVAAVGETIRHVAYGIILGLAYPILPTHRRIRVLPHTPAELRAEGDALPVVAGGLRTEDCVTGRESREMGDRG